MKILFYYILCSVVFHRLEIKSCSLKLFSRNKIIKIVSKFLWYCRLRHNFARLDYCNLQSKRIGKLGDNISIIGHEKNFELNVQILKVLHSLSSYHLTQEYFVVKHLSIVFKLDFNSKEFINWIPIYAL